MPTSVPLIHHPPSTSYRLFELPPAVETLLESPTAPVLTIDDSPEASTAVLRTPNGHYALRQKNTSNSLLILSSSSAPQGLAVVANIHETFGMQSVPSHPAGLGRLRHNGSGGKWHERFGKNR
ncbi:Sister chromatid cohesion protein DCC1 [Ophiocordyceps camponoti-floridani]|uniref:Sister chromatid cohesion protein DCC1 n=1 Tax=Ophiocordyceps camponoti-floridani TaxID=2030778 RepID=A0A8H4Q7F3_9HYPO|nr:Sister chromatid cohesion protein DCC1 [Ophiocordyceps camponoti-floridani]